MGQKSLGARRGFFSRGPSCMMNQEECATMPTIARALTLLVLAAFAASPLQAQKKARRDPTKIPQEELAEYGDANMYEVIPRARPDFLHPLSLSPGDRVVTGVLGVLIYVESQQLGDETALRYYRASDIKE